MPDSEGPRATLGFESGATAEFAFLLSDFGLRLVESSETRVRYESARRFVNVFHGRRSYEVSVELGRWVDVSGSRIEQMFPLQSILSIQNQGSLLERAITATSPRQVARTLRRLAELTRTFARPLLDDGDDVFEELSRANAAWSQGYLEGIRASRLRARADEAWQRRDLDAVAFAYTEIDTELGTVSLKSSERARLNYARKHLDGG